MMGAAELAELAENIGIHGQALPIIVHDGMILDGRNRWRACEMAGITPRTAAWDGVWGSPTLYVLSINLHRRHLSESQRAMAAAAALPILEAEARERQRALAGTRPNVKTQTATLGPIGTKVPVRAQRDPRSAERAAQAAGSSSRAVGRAKPPARVPRASASIETAAVAPMWSLPVPGVRVGTVAGDPVMVEILRRSATMRTPKAPAGSPRRGRSCPCAATLTRARTGVT